MSVLSYLSRALNLQKASINKDELTGCCPLAPWEHEGGTDNNPSFKIKELNGTLVYGCMSCGHKGRIDDLIVRQLFKRTKDRNYLKIFHSLIHEYEISTDNAQTLEKHKDIYLNKAVYEDILPDVTEYKAAMDYCIGQRFLTEETCDRLGLKYHPEFRRIVFSIYDYYGRLLGHTGRATDPEAVPKIWTTVNSTIKRNHLGIHKLKLDKPTILVEGLFIYAMFHQFGLDKDYNILCTMGVSITSAQVQQLISISTPLILFLDNDEAGRNAMYGKTGSPKKSLKDLCTFMPVYSVEYPEGISDPDDLTREQVYSMLANKTLINVGKKARAKKGVKNGKSKKSILKRNRKKETGK